MENTKKIYRIPRDKLDQVISWRTRDGGVQRAPGPGHKHQASSAKLFEHQATSFKPQAASFKLQATSFKLQDS